MWEYRQKPACGGLRYNSSTLKWSEVMGSKYEVEFWLGVLLGPQKSLLLLITRETRNVKHTGLFSKEEIKYLFFCPEDWEWVLLMTWWPFYCLWMQTSPNFPGRIVPRPFLILTGLPHLPAESTLSEITLDSCPFSYRTYPHCHM